jgi:hypothetical protein
MFILNTVWSTIAVLLIYSLIFFIKKIKRLNKENAFLTKKYTDSIGTAMDAEKLEEGEFFIQHVFTHEFTIYMIVISDNKKPFFCKINDSKKWIGNNNTEEKFAVEAKFTYIYRKGRAGEKHYLRKKYP